MLQALDDARATFAAAGTVAPQPGRMALGAMPLTGLGTATAIVAVQTQLAVNVAPPTAPPLRPAGPTP